MLFAVGLFKNFSRGLIFTDSQKLIFLSSKIEKGWKIPDKNRENRENLYPRKLVPLKYIFYMVNYIWICLKLMNIILTIRSY